MPTAAAPTAAAGPAALPAACLTVSTTPLPFAVRLLDDDARLGVLLLRFAPLLRSAARASRCSRFFDDALAGARASRGLAERELLAGFALLFVALAAIDVPPPRRKFLSSAYPIDAQRRNVRKLAPRRCAARRG